MEHVGGGGVQPHRDGDGVLHGLPHGVLEEMLRQKKGSERSKPGHGDRWVRAPTLLLISEK